MILNYKKIPMSVDVEGWLNINLKSIKQIQYQVNNFIMSTWLLKGVKQLTSLNG